MKLYAAVKAIRYHLASAVSHKASEPSTMVVERSTMMDRLSRSNRMYALNRCLTNRIIDCAIRKGMAMRMNSPRVASKKKDIPANINPHNVLSTDFAMKALWMSDGSRSSVVANDLKVFTSTPSSNTMNTTETIKTASEYSPNDSGPRILALNRMKTSQAGLTITLVIRSLRLSLRMSCFIPGWVWASAS